MSHINKKINTAAILLNVASLSWEVNIFLTQRIFASGVNALAEGNNSTLSPF